jgi:hypothetical protein
VNDATDRGLIKPVRISTIGEYMAPPDRLPEIRTIMDALISLEGLTGQIIHHHGELRQLHDHRMSGGIRPEFPDGFDYSDTPRHEPDPDCRAAVASSRLDALAGRPFQNTLRCWCRLRDQLAWTIQDWRAELHRVRGLLPTVAHLMDDPGTIAANVWTARLRGLLAVLGGLLPATGPSLPSIDDAALGGRLQDCMVRLMRFTDDLKVVGPPVVAAGQIDFETETLMRLAGRPAWGVDELPGTIDADTLRCLDEREWVEARYVIMWNQKKHPADTTPPLPSPSEWFSPMRNPQMAGDWDAIVGNRSRGAHNHPAEVRLSDRGRATLARRRRAGAAHGSAICSGNEVPDTMGRPPKSPHPIQVPKTATAPEPPQTSAGESATSPAATKAAADPREQRDKTRDNEIVGDYITRKRADGVKIERLTRDGIARATGIPTGSVSATPAWKALSKEKKQTGQPSARPSDVIQDHPGEIAGSGAMDLEQAIERQDWKAVEKLQAEEAGKRRV